MLLQQGLGGGGGGGGGAVCAAQRACWAGKIHFTHFSRVGYMFCGKSRAKAQLISDFTEPGFRKLKGHPVPSSETLTSTESPP